MLVLVQGNSQPDTIICHTVPALPEDETFSFSSTSAFVMVSAILAIKFQFNIRHCHVFRHLKMSAAAIISTMAVVPLGAAAPS